MTIRDATLHDVDELVRMAEAFLEATPYGSALPTDPERLRWFTVQLVSVGKVLVAELPLAALGDPPQLAGMIAAYVGEHPISRQRYADEQVWWVDPLHRTKDLGYNLLTALQTWTTAEGLGLKMIAPAGSRLGVLLSRLGYVQMETVWFKQAEV